MFAGLHEPWEFDRYPCVGRAAMAGFVTGMSRLVLVEDIAECLRRSRFDGRTLHEFERMRQALSHSASFSHAKYIDTILDRLRFNLNLFETFYI